MTYSSAGRTGTTTESRMTKRKAVPATPVQAIAWGQAEPIAAYHGLVVRPEDRAEFVLMLNRASDLGLPVTQAVAVFKAARAAMAGVLVGKQRPSTYTDDRRRGFASARHACLIPADA